MVQTEGFHIVEGTAEHGRTLNPKTLLSPAHLGLSAPDDEIAWETVEQPTPAAASPTAAGDTAPAHQLAVT